MADFRGESACRWEAPVVAWRTVFVRFSQIPPQMAADAYRFEVAISYASEDSLYVARVARELEKGGIPFFYDQNPEAAMELWGRELPQQLESIYSRDSRYVVIFASAAYERKIWTRYEMKWAIHTALRLDRDYLLPARFDQTTLPGLPPDLVYANLCQMTPEVFASRILAKVGAARLEGEAPARSIDIALSSPPSAAPASPEDWF